MGTHALIAALIGPIAGDPSLLPRIPLYRAVLGDFVALRLPVSNARANGA